ncbi:MAG: PepSY domain-containing protein [Microvirga sp.]
MPAPHGWGSTSSENAREAVSQGWALALSAVLPTVSRAVPGQVLEVDLRQSWGGEWRYEFLVLTRDRRYQEVVVDARNNQILQIRRR